MLQKCLRISGLCLSLMLVAPLPGRTLGWDDASAHFVIHHPPDPVNVQTGNFFLPVQDLYLPCYGFPLEVHRSYNSVGNSVSAFGMGWTFNYHLQISVLAGDKLTVVEPDGFINTYIPVQSQDSSASEVEAIVNAKRAEDIKYLGQAKSDETYEKLRAKLTSDAEFFKRQRTLYLVNKEVSIVATGKFVSRQRGTTYIYRTQNGFERHTQEGRIEYYSTAGNLRGVRDRNGNELTFKFEQDKLAQVRDGCGQTLKLSYNSAGRIASITDHLSRTLNYSYDSDQRLVSSRGLDGKVTRYQYDSSSGRMNRLSFADGSETSIVYDKQSGRVSRQEGPGTKITNYNYGKRGSNYDWSEVKTNEGGYLKYELFPKENKTIYTDNTGVKTVTILSSCCSKPLSITNQKGEGEFYKYDDAANLLERSTSAGMTTRYTYEPRFLQPDSVVTPDGVSTRYTYDGTGNLISVKTSKSEELKLRYNGRGKIISASDHLGNLITYDYNVQGKPTRVEKNLVKEGKEKKLSEMRIVYHPNGDIENIKYIPDTPKVIEEMRATLIDQMRLLSAAGVSFDI